MITPDAPPDFLDRVRIWLSRPRTRLAVCWLVCLAITGQRWYHARYEYDTNPDDTGKHRADGNFGHTHIDFGGQWVFARLAATGQFRHLYHRDAQWAVVQAAYRLDRQSEAKRAYSFPKDHRPNHFTSDDVKTDADYLMGCMMGDDGDLERATALAPVLGLALLPAGDGNPFAAVALQSEANARLTPEVRILNEKPRLGGPLYPPVHAVLYAPLGFIDNPQSAYRLFQWLSLAACFLSGWCIRVISSGRIWWPVATSLVLLYSGGRPGLDLGQNHYLTLTIVLGGWALAVRGREFTGGAVWGLLAFKPVWGLAFILMPVLMRRWRFVVGTGVCGVGLVLFTLPFVGVQGWQEWLKIGGDAAKKYGVNENWVNLSRDVSGIPRRLMMDYSKPEAERNTWQMDAASTGCLIAVFTITGAVYLGWGDWRKPTGLSAAFLAFGAYLSCYRFMYYDSILALLGFALLLANPAWLWRTPTAELTTPGQPASARRVRLYVASVPLTLLALAILNDNMLIGLTPQGTVALGRWEVPTKGTDGKETTRPRRLTAASDWNHPVETLLVLGVWAWCGWRLIRDGRRADDDSVKAVG